MLPSKPDYEGSSLGVCSVCGYTVGGHHGASNTWLWTLQWQVMPSCGLPTCPVRPRETFWYQISTGTVMLLWTIFVTAQLVCAFFLGQGTLGILQGTNSIFEAC